MKNFILGSASPRRKEIMEFFSLPFTQEAPTFDERSIPFQGDPEKYVTELTLGKLKELKEKFPNSMIVTADTVVFCNNKVYNKPVDENEAFLALKELEGKWHSVFTALSFYDGGTQVFSAVEETKVLCNHLNDEEIRNYHSKIHWMDKAAGYAIQTGAGLIVNKIDGCYYNVMGLPINTLHKLLKHAGINLFDHIK